MPQRTPEELNLSVPVETVVPAVPSSEEKSQNFSQYQENICEVVHPPPPGRMLCPPCVPQKSFIPPRWKEMVNEIYLNEATCEYEICVTLDVNGEEWFNEPGRWFPDAGVDRDRLLRKYVQAGIRIMLEDAGKIENPQQIICASHRSPSLPEEFTLTDIMDSFVSFEQTYEIMQSDPLPDEGQSSCPDMFIPKKVSQQFEPGQPINMTEVVENILDRSPNITNPFALEIYAYPKKWTIDPMQKLLKVLIAIPAFLINAVPDAPTAEELKEKAAQTKNEVKIKTKDFWGASFRFKKAMAVYGKYQAFFGQTQDAELTFSEPIDGKRAYYANSYSGKMDTFRNELLALGKTNGWNFRSNVPSLVLQNARKIKIKFKKTPVVEETYKGLDPTQGAAAEAMASAAGRTAPTNYTGVLTTEPKPSPAPKPYKIEGIYAQKKGCEWEKLTKGMRKFKRKWGKETTFMNYVAKLSEIDAALQASQSYPWLDFLIKFTYPVLKIDYGTYDPEKVAETAGECVAENLREFGGELKDYVLNEILTMAEIMAYEFNSKNCATIGELRLQNQPEETEFKDWWDNKRGSTKETRFSGLKGREAGREQAEQEFQDEKASLELELANYDLYLQSIDGKIEAAEEERRAADRAAIAKTHFVAESIAGSDYSNAYQRAFEAAQDPETGSMQVIQAYRLVDNAIANIDGLNASKITMMNERRNKDQQLRFMIGDGGAKTRRRAGRLEATRRRDEKHPYIKSARKLAMEEWLAQDTLLKSLVDFDTFAEQGAGALNFTDLTPGNEKFQLEDILERMSECNLGVLIKNALRCLLSGTTKERAFDKMIRSTLQAMDLDVFGIFINNLPPRKQVEMRKKLKKIFRGVEMPLPWEEDYDPGAMYETNAYQTYLRPKKAREVDPTQEEQEVDDEAWLEEYLAEQYATKAAQEAEAAAAAAEDARISGGAAATAAYEDAVAEEQARQDAQQAADDKAYDMLEHTSEGAYGFQSPEQIQRAREKADEEDKAREAADKAAQDRLTQLKNEIKKFYTVPELEAAAEQMKAKVPEGEPNAGDPQPPGTFGSAIGDLQQLLVETYIELIMDSMHVDELMGILEQFPGSGLVMNYITTLRCAYQGLFSPPIAGFLGTLTLDPCGDHAKTSISLPQKMDEIFPLPNFFDKSMLERLRGKFRKTLDRLLTTVLTMLLVKVLQTVDDMLCKGLNALGKTAASKLSGQGGTMRDAMAEAFCPKADPAQLDDIQKKLFKAAGLGIPGVNDKSFSDLFATLNATTTKEEITGLLVSKPGGQDRRVTRRIGELVITMHSEFSDVFGDADTIGDVFTQMGNLIPEELRIVLQEEMEGEDEPVVGNFCLTKADWCRYKELKEEIIRFPGAGAGGSGSRDGPRPTMSQETVEELVRMGDDELDEEIKDLADILSQGPDGILGGALDDLVKTLNDPACATPGNSIIEEDDELAASKHESIMDLYKNIERTFVRELIAGRNAVLNNILRDKNNFRLKKHQRRTNMTMIFPNYVNSQEDWDFRLENSNKLITSRMKGVFTKNDGPQGTYPETVGGWMRDELLAQEVKYESKAKGSEIEFTFNNSPSEVTYKFKAQYNVKHLKGGPINMKVTTTRELKIGKLEALRIGAEVEEFRSTDTERVLDVDIHNGLDVSEYETFDYDVHSAENSYQSMIFKSLLDAQIETSIDTRGKLKSTCDSFNQRLFKLVKEGIVGFEGGDMPVGFKFGYDPSESIRFDDLYYVNPEPGSTQYTHQNRDKILGRSMTNNKRVHFLDPAIHGGFYKAPKIYIEPAKYKGWLGMMRVFIPEVEQCGKRDNGFLNVSQIAKRVKQIENTIPFDERLSVEDHCRVEPPYDKIFAASTHGFMEGSVLATVRVYATEFILRSLPIFGSIAFTEKNIDGTFNTLLANEMKKGLISQQTPWNLVQGYTYYLMFIEQATQVVQRQIVDELMEETPEIKAAFEEIGKIQAEFKPVRFDPKKIMEKSEWEKLSGVINGSAIIGFGEDWEGEAAKMAWEKYIKDPVKMANRFKFLTPFKLQLANKIYYIYKSRKAAEVLLGVLIRQELGAIITKLTDNMSPPPKIYDIQKYLLSKEGIAKGSTTKSGYFEVEKPAYNPKLNRLEAPEYGNILDVVEDVSTQNPLSFGELIPLDNEDKNGFFYLERYIRVIGKATKESQDAAAASRFRGTSPPQEAGPPEQVYNIKEFQNILKTFDRNRTLSDYYGNAIVVNRKLYGSIGVKFGVRLVFCPPSSFKYSSPLQTPEVAQRERSYYFQKQDFGGNKRAIPVAVFEQDVIDKKIKDLDLEDENFGEELKCYIDRLAETKKFQICFGMAFPVRSYVSLFGLYGYYAFFESIAADPDNTEEMDEDPNEFKQMWKDKVFKRTKKRLRRLFNSTYRTDDDVKEERSRNRRSSGADFLKNILPNAYLGLDPSVAWWQRLRVIKYRPFDADGKPCKNEFQKMFG